jgi:glycosyltransferase involved in cell wall biosynthesis
MIRVLHLFANHKLTGPAELALDTAWKLEKAYPDLECRFLPARHPKDPFWIGELARERKARLVEVEGLRLQKHFNPMRAFFDSRRLARYLRENPADLLHCHLPNDHLVAGFALRLLRSGIPIVRTLYDGDPIEIDWRTRRNLVQNCERIICFSRRVRDQLRNGELSLPAAHVLKVDPPIDTERFKPPSAETRAGYRSDLGIPDDAFVAGIVARMQTHRRYEVLLEAIRIVRDRIPSFRFLIIGRGTHQEEVAREPVRKLGLEKNVIFTGYRGGDDYLPVLQSMDVKVFLVPGSDGTCRAVREALASGIPVIAANRGMLPELVVEGKTGRVIEDSAENLAAALVEMAADRKSYPARARESAVSRFSYDPYLRSVRAVYDSVLGGKA